MRQCVVCANRHLAKGYCRKHYLQVWRKGKTYRTAYEPNEIVDTGDYCEMLLYSRDGCEIARTKFSRKHKDRVSTRKWCLDGNGYAQNSSKQHLHRFIYGDKEGMTVDHVNGDRLDNRDENLRYATRQQQQFNRRCNGYGLRKDTGRWSAQITVNGKTIYLGCFENEKDALATRIKAEKEYHGEYAQKRKGREL